LVEPFLHPETEYETTGILEITIQAASMDTGSGMKNGKLTVSHKKTGSGEIKGKMIFNRKDYGMNKGIPFIKIADHVDVNFHLKQKQVSGPPLAFDQQAPPNDEPPSRLAQLNPMPCG
jgi:hypothetical protein